MFIRIQKVRTTSLNSRKRKLFLSPRITQISTEVFFLKVFVIQNGTKCSEDELLRARPKNLGCIHVVVHEILRRNAPLDDKYKRHKNNKKICVNPCNLW